MNMAIPAWLFLYLVTEIFSVPPDVCFENFNWEDCGRAPTAVLYYYKPGSRCEVGLWRGCWPNPNMFPNEYECVQTCIFTVRAHKNPSNDTEVEDYDRDETTTDGAYTNSTDVAFTNSTGTEVGDTTDTVTTLAEEDNATVTKKDTVTDTSATESVTERTEAAEGTENVDQPTETPQAEAEPNEK